MCASASLLPDPVSTATHALCLPLPPLRAGIMSGHSRGTGQPMTGVSRSSLCLPAHRDVARAGVPVSARGGARGCRAQCPGRAQPWAPGASEDLPRDHRVRKRQPQLVKLSRVMSRLVLLVAQYGSACNTVRFCMQAYGPTVHRKLTCVREGERAGRPTEQVLAPCHVCFCMQRWRQKI